MAAANGKTKPSFNWTFSHFINFPQQLASKLVEHKNTGNFICHLIGGPVSGLAGIALVQNLFGDNAAIGCAVINSLIAIANDLPNGFVYTAISMVTTMYQLELFRDTSIYVILGMMASAFTLQIAVGHGYFEGEMPTEEKSVVKFRREFFNSFYFVNAVVFGTFHFYSILALRLGLRSGLHAKVTEEFNNMMAVIKSTSK